MNMYSMNDLLGNDHIPYLIVQPSKQCVHSSPCNLPEVLSSVGQPGLFQDDELGTGSNPQRFGES